MKVRQPLFNVDGASAGNSQPTGFGDGWRSMLEQTAPAEEVQPVTDTEAEAVEADEQDSETEVEASDDQPEMESEGEETAEEAEATPEVNVEVDADPDVDMGEGKKPVKMSELKNGYMRQSDYTKKTQELATQRKEVETLQESLKGAQEWQKHLESNPWLWQQINSAMKSFYETGALPLEEALQDAQYGHYINHLMAENTKLKKEMDTLRGDYEGVKLTGEMSKLQTELKGEYGDLVTDDYMQNLQERAKKEKLSTSTLREIADGYLAKEKLKTAKTDVKKASKEAEAKTIQKLQETRQNAPAAPNKATAATPSSKSEVKSGESWREMFARISG